MAPSNYLMVAEATMTYAGATVAAGQVLNRIIYDPDPPAPLTAFLPPAGVKLVADPGDVAIGAILPG